MKKLYKGPLKTTLAFCLVCSSFASADTAASASAPNMQVRSQDRSYNTTPVRRGDSSYYSRSSANRQNYYAENYNQNYGASCETEECCDDCCDGGGFWSYISGPLIGFVAGIAGGILGAEIINNDGHDGDDGATGPQGPTGATGPTGPQGPGFTADTGQTLDFRLTGLFPTIPPGTLAVIPFATGPNGVTMEGPLVQVPAIGGTILFPNIIFTDPVFGTYNFGFSLDNSNGATISGITLNGTLVLASRDGSVTEGLTPLAGVNINPGKSQISSPFTYDPQNIP